MHIAFVYGKFSSGIHGSFDLNGLYHNKGLTGSESSFFNMVTEMAHRGHTVEVFCDCITNKEMLGDMFPGGLYFWTPEMFPLRLRSDAGIDTVVAWNEPDYLRFVSDTKLRICNQQLNDFMYCAPGFDATVDKYVFPSNDHRNYIVKTEHIRPGKTDVLPNSILPWLYDLPAVDRGHTIAYCSSPDRGLHWLLNFFPRVRAQVPDATLHIYYKYQPWSDGIKNSFDPGCPDIHKLAGRARYIDECLTRLGQNGENGVFVHGSIPNVAMAKALNGTKVFAYPCDTVRYTEGFSVSTMDACAAGCIPIVSDCDAIGEIYKSSTLMINGHPRLGADMWVDTIVKALTDDALGASIKSKAAELAAQHHIGVIASSFENMIDTWKSQRTH